MNLSRVILSIALCLPAFSQQEVLVANQPKAPALVQLAPAEPFHRTFSLGYGPAPGGNFFTVPAKKRLVIENISLLHRGGSLSSHTVFATFLHLLIPNGQPQVTVFLPVDRIDFTPGAQFPMTAQTHKSSKMYLEPGTVLQTEFLVSGSFVYSASITISGYFVDVP